MRTPSSATYLTDNTSCSEQTAAPINKRVEAKALIKIRSSLLSSSLNTTYSKDLSLSDKKGEKLLQCEHIIKKSIAFKNTRRRNKR